jgi:pimeloyl-ACP methyl ester carboxylesterase
MQTWAQRQLRVGGHRLHVQDGGTGTPAAVMIHGVGVSSWYFEPLLRELAPVCRVIAFDLPGFGRSSRPKGALNLDELADVTAGLIRELGLVRPVVVGHSMGAELAVKLALRHPGLAGKLVLIGPTVNDQERTWWRQAQRLMQDGLREPVGFNVQVAWDYLRCGLPRYIRTLRFMLADRIETGIAGVPNEILVVRGQRDPIAQRPWAQKLTDRAPRGRLAEVSGGTHGSQFMKSGEVAKLCREFMGQ